jgi:D-aspartate ligase
MDFEIVIVGTDINAYYMARCCHEAYNKKPYLIGKEKMNYTALSNILNITYVDNLWDKDVFVESLVTFAKDHPKKKLLLIGTNDFYIRLMVENKKILKKYYYFYAVDLKLLDNLLVKDNFYTYFKNSDLDMPQTYIYPCNKNESLDIKRIKKFKFPIIIKPGDGVNYYKHKFEGQAKVYKVFNNDELKSVIEKIETSGYDANLIIQEFIPGDDSMLFDSIFFCTKDKEVKLVSFAQIGLQEHTSTGVGNCTVLVNGYSEFGNYDEQIEKMKNFLEENNYEGFAEFDLKYDVRDNKYKVFEINPRQARSSYYLASCGYNLVKYMVDDLIKNKTFKYKVIKEKMVLTFVPKYIIKKYIKNSKLKKQIKLLIKAHKIVNPLSYKKDNNFKRKLWLFARKLNYIRKYKHSNW